MSLNFSQALKYPYRKANWLSCIVAPGALYVVNLLISFVAVVLLWGIALLMVFLCFGSDAASEALEDARWTSSLFPTGVGAGWAALKFAPADLIWTASASPNLIMGIFEMLGHLIGFVLDVLCGVWLIGFQWHLFARLQREGLDAPAPGILQFKGFLADGWKPLLLYGLIGVAIAIPLVIPIISLALLVPRLDANATPVFVLALLASLVLVACVASVALFPYYWAPMIHSAQTRRLRELFDIRAALATVRGRYKRAMGAWFWTVIAGLAYMIVLPLLILGTCGVGLLALPFLFSGALSVTGWHLMAQAFYGPSPSPAAAQEPVPSAS